jgi:hypothetical protein
MRYPASEKLEIIRLVEQSHLPAKRTLDKLGIPRRPSIAGMTASSPAASMRLEDRKPQPGRVWNRIPDDIRDRIIDLALDEPELSPRELAVTFTDTRKLLRLGILGLPPAQGAGSDHQSLPSSSSRLPTSSMTRPPAPNQLWQTDFTYRAPRPGWSGVHMTGMHGERRNGRLPCPLLQGGMSPSGGDLPSTGRVT